jgi:hypothetical protein
MQGHNQVAFFHLLCYPTVLVRDVRIVYAMVTRSTTSDYEAGSSDKNLHFGLGHWVQS